MIILIIEGIVVVVILW